MWSKLSATEGFKRLAMQALVVLGLVVLGSGLVVAFYYIPLPDVGFDSAGGTHVGSVAPGGPADAAGLQVGDEILSRGGEASMPGEAYLHSGQETLQLVVARDGQAMPLEIVLRPPSLLEILDRVIYFLIALGYWAIAMIVLFLKPRDSVSQLFVLVALLGTLGIVIWPMADLVALWANLLMPFIALAVGPLFVHYNTVFPERVEFKGRKLLLAGLYGISLVLLALSTASDLIFYLWFGGEGDWPPSLAAPIKAYFSLCLLAGLALLWRTYHQTRSETSRQQIAFVMLGTFMALLPLILLIIIPQVLATSYVVPTWLSLLALAFIPLSYLYATYRHNLMKLDWVINRSVIFFFLAVILATLYLGLSLTLHWLLPGVFVKSITLADVFLFLALVFLLDPLRRRIERGVDRVFYGGWYSYETFIYRMSDAFKDAVEMKTVTSLLANDVAETMRFKAVAVLLSTAENPDFYVRESRGFEGMVPIGHKGHLAAHLLEAGEPVLDAELCDRLRSGTAAQQELDTWSRAGAQMWVPLVQQEELVGILIVGGKLADDFFYPADHRILATIAQQAAAAIVRVRLVDQAQALAGQIMALQERNQQQVFMDLHDLVLPDVISARNFLDDAEKRFLPQEVRAAREILTDMAKYLDTVLFELQPPERSSSDLRVDLENCIWKFRRMRRLPITFHAQGEGGDVFVPDEVWGVVYRILQESLNNAQKHARAQQIEVTLDLRPGYVRLEVCDDGVGFDVPRYTSAHVRRSRMGLVIMHTRAWRVGGHFEIESQPGQGTRVSVEVPWATS